MIGKLQRVPLREVWKNEAQDFIPWLQENLDVLNGVIDRSFESAEREEAAGSFSVDLVAEDEAGNPVVIECQLGKSDHDHLGKLLTYLTAVEAKTAVWLTAEPRAEHVGAVTWLNESTAASFFLVKVEAIRIGDSPAAPLLTLIVGPSEEARDAGRTKEDVAERHVLRLRFWSLLLDKAKNRTKLHAKTSPSQYHWVGTGAGIRGLGYNYTVTQHGTSVELYIDRGKDAREENKAIYDQLARNKAEVEREFGEPLEWERLESKRACRIVKRLELGGYRDDEEKWPEVQDATIDAMVRLEKALKPYISRLRV